MDTSYLAQQVNTIIGQLHGLFDEIGVPNHDRETREAELFAAVSEALHNQVRLVTAEKKDMIEEATRMINNIRQMEASLDGSKARRDYQSDDEDVKVTFPLTRCLQVLKEKQIQIGRLHRERFEQVKKLVQALESYSSHLEPTFVRIPLPPTGANQSIPPNFDLSPSYVDKLDEEFTRVYEEYTRRVGTVKALCESIIQLWAELGTPQAQTDGAIVQFYRDAPEQLGLHEEDLARLRAKRDKLVHEKNQREKRLRELRAAVEALWDKLGVEEAERKAFLSGNRGCGVRPINEFEDELARLNELKRANLHLFVEDARCRLQELWDALYFSEDEMLDFTPAFSDVYSDALLEAHEREVARLEAVREQRAPALALVDRHKQLVQERDELAASSQDASRLMMRGQKGEKRDPGKLLREEKMRKRIAKELPKVAAELRRVLEQWEDEYGRPFLVFGERYLDNLEAEDGISGNNNNNSSKPVPGPRSKTPGPPPPTSTAKSAKSAALSRANSVNNLNSKSTAYSKSTTCRPTAASTTKSATLTRPNTANGTAPKTNTQGSPTRIPARAPLSTLKNGNNSPERPRAQSRANGAAPGGNGGGSVRHGNPLMRAPPPKMRELLPAPELETPANYYRATTNLGSSVIRHIEPEDVYDDRDDRDVPSRQYPSISTYLPNSSRPASRDQYSHSSSTRQQQQNERLAQSGYANHNAVNMAPAPAPRQISNTSSATTAISGSENWETYDDDASEPELDASDAYYAKVRAARAGAPVKRATPEAGYGTYGRARGESQPKRPRGLPPHVGHGGNMVMVDSEGNRIVSGSEWTDEDAF